MDDKFNNNSSDDLIKVKDLFSDFTSSKDKKETETPPVDLDSIDFGVLDEKDEKKTEEKAEDKAEITVPNKVPPKAEETSEVYTTDTVAASSDDYSDFDFGDFDINDMPDYDTPSSASSSGGATDYDDFDFGDFELEEKPKKQKKSPAERKKKLMEMRISLVSVAVIILVFGIGMIYMLFFPKSTVSQIEKRTLASFPSFSLSNWFSGSFTSGINEWFTDTVPNRDALKNAGYDIKAVFGLPSSDDDVIFVNNATKKTGETDTTSSETSDSSEVSTAETAASDTSSAETSTTETSETGGTEISDATLEGSAGRRSVHITIGTIADTEEDQKDFTKQDDEFDWSDGLIIVQQEGHYRVLGLFGNGDDTSYVSALNELRKELDSSIKIWNMPCPLASEFYTPSNALEYTASQSDRFDEIAGELDSGITSINVCPVLQKHTEEDIYLRTDHHWSQLGAYYAARTFAEAAGVPFADKDTFESGVNEGYVGSYYGYTQDYRVLNDPEDFPWWKQKEDVTTYYYDRNFEYQYTGNLYMETDTANSYIMYMGGDDQIVKVTGTANNGRKLIIVKDSYGNAEIPWYVASFDEIYVVDLRYFNLNFVDFIDFTGATDVLFSMCSYSVVGGNSENLETMLTQNKGATIVDEALTSSDSSN